MSDETTSTPSTSPLLDAVMMDVEDLTPHPENARRGNIELIKESLQVNGQYRPIIVNYEGLTVLAGNHTYLAAKELGWKEIAVSLVRVTPEQAQRILLVDNRANDVAGYDDEALATMLQGLMLAGQLQGTGFNPDDVDDLMSALDALPVTEPAPTEAEHGISDEALAERFQNRSQAGPLRQFVLMYTQEDGQLVEQTITRLGRAWGVSGARDVVKEALRRAVQEPPIEHLSPEEVERANADPADETPETET